MKHYFRKQIAIPQDHGSWVFILSPLAVGLFAARSFSPASLALCVAAMVAFLLRQPLTAMVKAYSGRRPRSDLPAAWFWTLVYGILALLTLGVLFLNGDGSIVYLAVPGIPVFVWHLWLVSRREERHQALVEIVATGVLSLAGPAAYWVGIHRYDPLGWWLWLLTWLQSAASIVYAYLRLEQRQWKALPNRWDRFRAGTNAWAFTSFNFFITTALGLGAGYLPRWIFVPYLVQWLETLWGIDHPSMGWKPIRIGTRQLLVSIIWTVLFIWAWST